MRDERSRDFHLTCEDRKKTKEKGISPHCNQVVSTYSILKGPSSLFSSSQEEENKVDDAG